MTQQEYMTLEQEALDRMGVYKFPPMKDWLAVAHCAPTTLLLAVTNNEVRLEPVGSMFTPKWIEACESELADRILLGDV
jgi:hypothetical protein